MFMKLLSFLIVLTSLSSGFCQTDDFYVFDGKSVKPVKNSDPSSVLAQIQEWQIWLYKDGQAKGAAHDRWGLISGKSVASVNQQLEAQQKQQRASEKFFGKPQVETYFNPYGPIAILKSGTASLNPAKSDAEKSNAFAASNKKLVDEAFDIKGKEVVMKAYAVEADYMSRHVGYKYGADASTGGGYSDCSHFVNDVLKQSGLNVPYVDTANIGWPHYVNIPANEAKPGDIIVRRWFDPKKSEFEGHMGIYTGDKTAKGNLGVQMGSNGVQTAIWGPEGWFKNGWFDPATSFQFYRPKP